MDTAFKVYIHKTWLQANNLAQYLSRFSELFVKQFGDGYLQLTFISNPFRVE